jgi:hypothetical protein
LRAPTSHAQQIDWQLEKRSLVDQHLSDREAIEGHRRQPTPPDGLLPSEVEVNRELCNTPPISY